MTIRRGVKVEPQEAAPPAPAQTNKPAGPRQASL
jgi:hypothetical protein